MKKTFLMVIGSLALGINTSALADPAPDFTVLVEKAMPAVVSIEVSSTMPTKKHLRRNQMPDFFEEFFGSPFDRLPREFQEMPEDGEMPRL